MVLVWLKKVYDSSSQLFRAFSVEFSHKQQTCAPFYQSDNCPMVSLAYNGIHLPISKARTIGLFWPFCNTYPIGDCATLCTANRPCSVFKTVSTVFVEFTALFFIFAYHAVNSFVRDEYAVFSQPTGYLLGRPLLSDKFLLYLTDDCILYTTVARSASFLVCSICLGSFPIIVSFSTAISAQLTRDGTRTNF